MMNNTIFSKLTILLLFLFSSSAASLADKVISKQTTLQINLNGITEREQGRISGIYVVGPEGKIFLPLLEEGIKAAGITSSALARKIEEAYRKAEIYVNPRFTVISAFEANPEIKEKEIKTLILGGQIAKPGPLVYAKNMTIYEAIMTAGGPKTFGSTRRVELIRGNTRGVYDMRKPESMNIKVYPGDNIIIPHKRFGE